MLTIYYSPHMTSVDNEAGRASGHGDPPLAEAGVEQARELARHYAAIPLDAVYCSDLRRATATVELAFGGRGLPVVVDSRLRETNFGLLNQHPVTEISDEAHLVEPFPGGESIMQAVGRVGDALRDALARYDGKTIVVIGHRATRFGIKYWCGEQTVEQIVTTPWEWLDVPIWRYELNAAALERPLR